MKPHSPLDHASGQTEAQAWVDRWRKAAPILETLRMESIRASNTMAAIQALELAYKSARLQCPRRTSSGLVEQQRWFQRGHR